MSTTTAAARSISRSPAAVSKKLNQFSIRRKHRPHSTQLFAGPGYFSSTNYTEDYGDPHTEPHYKPEGPTDVRNNPHPTEAFMVYHLSKKETPQNVSYSDILKLESLVAKQETATTYQEDYFNYQVSPEKVPMKRFLSPKREEDDLPLIDSTMHHDYKVPVQNFNLKGNTTRYGCNEGIVKAAHGAIPTLDKQTLPPMSKYKTLYASDFGSSVRGSAGERRKKNANKNKNVSIHLPALINSQADAKSHKAVKRSGR